MNCKNDFTNGFSAATMLKTMGSKRIADVMVLMKDGECSLKNVTSIIAVFVFTKW